VGSQGADVFLGGDGDDFIFGDNGNDLALMGAGDDVFQWDPGDGSDILEGQDGIDSMLFFGSNASENIDVSANGGRVRSNNFMIDGQDTNDPSVAGGQQSINNPDIVQEVRLITNQFLPEYGRNAGSILNIITKAGTNEYHGTVFMFHNDNNLNSCSNLNKSGGFCNSSATDPSKRKAPFRIENQIGFTIGGPLHLPAFGEGGKSYISGRDRTFFFGSYQRWSDRRLGSGFTLVGAPTEAGRAVLQSAVGGRPQVAALLRFLPAAQDSSGPVVRFTSGGQTFSVPTGRLTGSASSTAGTGTAMTLA
jgi:hypothetical protein